MERTSRIVCAGLALILGINAVVQMAQPFWWYNAVPGVPATGPYNPHFVKDIGAAYLAAVLGLAWFAARPRQGWPALVAGGLFLGLHAGVHVFDASCSADPVRDLVRDFPGVFLPAIAAILVAVVFRPKEA
ncbi:MAG TPA: hypothetical protein PLV04_05810 [Phenylobacterium sp.]|jgi:hypothetical protein|uniref:DoxX-like family protein n=1 Tax=Phenylobacterium conjunctum TaxID=1298959 RepID=A0ABW3SZF3_9CAUL|nr:hypothetical protein [Phenylobacterium sp.]HQN52408.1 hypothetical protein [Phenylobacterium sp.]HQP21251.1 hypothetical protein [Phenylobacterium sp.]